jgi:hypothetical protein
MVKNNNFNSIILDIGQDMAFIRNLKILVEKKVIKNIFLEIK